MHVSVVVRSYNRAAYLAQALESVLCQARPPDRVGPLDERERVNEDSFLLLRLARVTLGACVPEPVALIRRHPGQVSAAHGLQAYTAAIRALEDLLRDPGLPGSVRRSARRTIGRFHAHVAR